MWKVQNFLTHIYGRVPVKGVWMVFYLGSNLCRGCYYRDQNGESDS